MNKSFYSLVKHENMFVKCANIEYALFFRTYCSTDDEETEEVSLLASHWTDIVGNLVHVEHANLRMDSTGEHG